MKSKQSFREWLFVTCNWRVSSGAMKGRQYNLDAFPCQSDILNDDAYHVAVMKAAQLALSEIFTCARPFYFMDVHKINWAILFPSQGAMQDFFKTRLMGAVNVNSYVRRNVTAQNTSNIEAFNRTLFERYTTTEAAIATFDASGVTVDEMDIHNKETLYGAKTSRTQGSMSDTWWYEISTPSYPKHGIHQAFLDGDQRVWLIKCQSCNHDNNLTEKFGPYDIQEIEKFFTEYLGDHRMAKWQDYHIPCSMCGRPIDPVTPLDPAKRAFGGGRWVSTLPARDEHSYALQIWQRRYDGGTPDVLKRVRRSLLRADGAELKKRWWNSTVGLPYVPKEGKLSDDDLERVSTTQYNDLWARDMLYSTVFRIHGEQWDWMGVDVRDNQYHIIGLNRQSKFKERLTGVGWVPSTSGVFELWERMGRPFLLQDAQPDMSETRKLVKSMGKRAMRAKFGKNILSMWQESNEDGLIIVNRPKAMEEVKAKIDSLSWIFPKPAWKVGAGIFKSKGENRVEETLADHFKAPTMIKVFSESSGNDEYDFPQDAMGGVDPHYFMAASLACVASKMAKAPSQAITVPR